MMRPYVGQIVLYVQRPGQVRGGQSELAALVTKVREMPEDDGPPILDLRIFIPDMHDVLVQQRVQQQSDTITGHCWRLTDADTARVAALSEISARLEALEDVGTTPAPAASRGRRATAGADA